uniref:Uncharacterized protein n=1 Tax=Eucampia antarctica TaxID=49252 RepID=A0A7S2S7B0_9STRA
MTLHLKSGLKSNTISSQTTPGRTRIRTYRKQDSFSYLPSNLRISKSPPVSSSSVATDTEFSSEVAVKKKKEGRLRRSRKQISKKVAFVNAVLMPNLLRRHKRIEGDNTTPSFPNKQSIPSEEEERDIGKTKETRRSSDLFEVEFQPIPISTTKMASAVNMAMVASGVKSPVSLINIKGEKSDQAFTKVGGKWVMVGAAGTAGLCLTTYALPSHALVDVSSLATTAFAPYVVYQKSELSELGSFREQQNALRETVNQITEENNKLKGNVDRLETSVDQLEEVEKNLSKLANTDNVDRLVSAVKETKKLNKEIKENLEARIAQDIITTVLRCDRDGDLALGKGEMNRLCFRLQSSAGYDFNDKKFRAVVGKPDVAGGYSIGKIMQVIRNLLDDKLSKEENIFELKPQKNMKFEA